LQKRKKEKGESKECMGFLPWTVMFGRVPDAGSTASSIMLSRMVILPNTSIEEESDKAGAVVEVGVLLPGSVVIPGGGVIEMGCDRTHIPF
jgi:hypothetical protein